MSNTNPNAGYERDEIVTHPERSFYASSQVNPNNHTKGLTDLDRYAFIANSQRKPPTSTATSLTNLFNAPYNSSQFSFDPEINEYQGPPQMPVRGRDMYVAPHSRTNQTAPVSSTLTNYGTSPLRELPFSGLQIPLEENLQRSTFALEAFDLAPPLPFYSPQDSGHLPAFDSYTAGWSASSVTPPYSRPISILKAASPRTRTRTTPRHQNHQYLDSLLRSKCPKDRIHALNVAIQFRDEHTVEELIPNDLLDELLDPAGEDKYYCFCCPRARKARTITPARDHVRKSLGNFPFQCQNAWCRHSSLRQADLNKHMKTCINSAASP